MRHQITLAMNGDLHIEGDDQNILFTGKFTDDWSKATDDVKFEIGRRILEVINL